MPTIHRQHGLRFIIYVDDHPPPHIHVESGQGRAKILLGSEPQLLWNLGLSLADLRRALNVVEDHMEDFMSIWASHHG